MKQNLCLAVESYTKTCLLFHMSACGWHMWLVSSADRVAWPAGWCVCRLINLICFRPCSLYADTSAASDCSTRTRRGSRAASTSPTSDIRTGLCRTCCHCEARRNCSTANRSIIWCPLTSTCPSCSIGIRRNDGRKPSRSAISRFIG